VKLEAFWLEVKELSGTDWMRSIRESWKELWVHIAVVWRLGTP
jgi:hypothetical protein